MRSMVRSQTRDPLTELRRGVLEHCVLAVLRDGESYAFDIVRGLSGAGELLTSEGTIYPLLARLRRDRLVTTAWRESDAGPPRRYYQISDAGRRALEKAGLTLDDVDHVNAHATSTPEGDRAELEMLRGLFGARAGEVSVTANKSMLGHTLGAAGSIEAAITILSLGHGVIPPTINQTTPDSDCDLDYVPNIAREARLDLVMSNGFGFGGTNSTLVFRRL